MIAFEDSWISLREINEYLQNGKGNPKSYLLKLYPVWHSETILELLKWLRKHNSENPKDPVHIVGFDVQDGVISGNFISDILEKSNDSSHIQALKNCTKILPESSVFDKDKKGALCDSCLSLSTKLVDMKKNFSEKIPYYEVSTISLKTSYARSCQKIEAERSMIRDKGMADVFQLLWENVIHKNKTIIWSANGHIHKKSYAPVSRSMGEHLTGKYGNDYKTVVIVASRYDAHKDFDFIQPQKSPPPGSLEEWLQSFGKKYLFVNFHKVPDKVLGVGKDDPMNPRFHTDGALYLRHSSAMKLVR